MDRTESNLKGNWVPLLEFAMRRCVSLSTLRRHIKANKLTYKIENGRYLLLDEIESNSAQILQNLEKDLQKAQKEIAELKTLIAFYEEKSSMDDF